MYYIRSNQRDPNPKGTLIGKETSTHKGFHSTFAALFSYQGVSVRVRVTLFATHYMAATVLQEIRTAIEKQNTFQQAAGQRRADRAGIADTDTQTQRTFRRSGHADTQI